MQLNSSYINHAAKIVRAGGVIAYPTESCFGLGCDPRNINSIRRILRIKRRPRAKGLIIIADKVTRLIPYAAGLKLMEINSDTKFNCTDNKNNLPTQNSQLLINQIRQSWPGPQTWILPATEYTSRWLRGDHANIAVRVTAHLIAARICHRSRTALVSTSANRSGRPILKTARAVQQEFGNEIDMIVPGKIGFAPAPTTIRDGITGAVIRA